MSIMDIKNENLERRKNDNSETILRFYEGFVVSRFYSIRPYLSRNMRLENAILPDIYVLKPVKNSCVSVSAEGIDAITPAEIYKFIFEPTWNKSFIEDNNLRRYFDPVAFFSNSFIPDGKYLNQEIGDFVVYCYDNTGLFDLSIRKPGRIPESGIEYSDLILYGNETDLYDILKKSCNDIPKNSYSSKINVVIKRKNYSFNPCCKDICEFAMSVITRLNLF